MQKKVEPLLSADSIAAAVTKSMSPVNSESAAVTKGEGLQDWDAKKAEKKVTKMTKGTSMKVRDPTTGDDVEIRNRDQSYDEPSSGENVLNMDFPPPDWEQHRQVILSTTASSLVTIGATYTASVLLFHFIPLPFVHHHSLIRLIVSLLLPSVVAYTLLFRLQKVSQSDFEDRAWHSERIRGLKAGSDVDGDGKVETEERTRESAEWANTLLRGIWPIVNPQLFQSSVDLLEDIMQSSMPSFIHSVRVADLGQGRNPLRITAIRSLRDVDAKEVMEALKGEQMKQFEGDHINLEVSFAYRAAPSGKSTLSKVNNAHLLIEFFMGIRHVWGFRVPVWVELKGVAGTARARFQLIPDPPFIKTTLVTLMGIPRVSIEVIPTKILPNVMNLPVISEFISSSIDAAAAQYVAPKSLTLDLQQLISGDDIKKDTVSIGVLVVHIHRATGIKKMDLRNTSDFVPDPYVTLAYSRLGKPMFSSRIIMNDLNPVFEETAILLVNVDHVKLKELLSIQIWDSDRMSADDLVGFVEVDIVDRMRNKNEAVRKVAPLEGADRKKRPGTVDFTVGYYAKMRPNSALKTDGSDPGIPEDLRPALELKEAKATALNDLEAAVLVTPPDPEYPSGILGVEIHEIKDLSVWDATTGKGEKGQNELQGVGLPSPYCTISINDELVYETRVKPLSSSPVFNAGTERVLRDWRNSHVTVVVKDSRVRENDGVLGIVFLKLSELFINASQITRSYPVEQGGRIRISVLFRPVALKLPQALLGFDTGLLTLRALNIKSDHKDISAGKCELIIRTSRSSRKEKITHKSADIKETQEKNWLSSRKIDLPVRQRYSTALLIEVNPGFIWDDDKAFAVFWLRDLEDSRASNVEIALWKSKKGDYSRIKQNYVSRDGGNLDGWSPDSDSISRIGTVCLDAVFLPGLSKSHQEMLSRADGKKRGMWEEFEREEAEGLREQVGKRKVKDASAARREPPDRKIAKDASTGTSNEDTVAEDDPEDAREYSREDKNSDDEGGTWKERWHRWREEKAHSHGDHHDMMQSKPVRTAKWLLDGVEIAGHKIKERLSHEAREPDIETEA